jgi:hypothetical protein
VVRAGHPLTECKVTKQRLFEFPHVVAELTGTEENERDGFIDDEGKRRSRRPRSCLCTVLCRSGSFTPRVVSLDLPYPPHNGGLGDGMEPNGRPR